LDRGYRGEREVFMADATSLEEIDQRIAVIRDNIRELTEQAAALSGAGDESRVADRIAEQEQLLSELLKERAALGG
jgi:rubrerythrin